MSRQDLLIDERMLGIYLADHLGEGGPLRVGRHQAGHSNETFFLTYGDRELVLRRPPRGAFLPTAHDVGREYKVLAALGRTNVRVPQVVLSCTDESILGSEFYVMERVKGEVIRYRIPGSFEEADRRLIGDELIDALVELHGVDPRSCGLEDFGRPSGYLERQLKRWQSQLELTLPHTRSLPALELVGEWLSGNVVESSPSTIVHGDFKLDNVIFATDPPVRLLAILDWEMSTLGDPLADLGWLISFWREPGDDTGPEVLGHLGTVTSQPGFASRKELVDRYESATDRDAGALDYYVVLCHLEARDPSRGFVCEISRG
jgi:aminoglycoside phosphotransferase (APT) family kinase protein